MRDLPRGTVTFLFTDIEGSTRLLKQLGERYAEVLTEHQRLLRAAFEGAEGREIDTQGDSFFFAFARAKDAVAAAIAAQRALAESPWPRGAKVRVRMGLHSGEPMVGEERYVGMGVHKAARIASAAHGGQTLLSQATRELVQDDLPPRVRVVDLGEHMLKDIDRPERIFQLDAPGVPHRFPPLRTDAPLPAASSRRRAAWASSPRALIAAGATVVVAAAAVVLALTMAGTESNPASGSPTAKGSEGQIKAGEDSNAIFPGRSIGALRLGMSTSEVKALFGSAVERPWVAHGKNGTRMTYPAPSGVLAATFYDDRAVQLYTTSSYYSTEDGVGVGRNAPSFRSPEQRDAALQRGELEEIEPGVYAWRGYVWLDESNSYCLRGEKAATQLLQTGFTGRIVTVAITDARFLRDLPIHAGLGADAADFYCAAQPLGP
jgi:class 3 adenylate cyclase